MGIVPVSFCSAKGWQALTGRKQELQMQHLTTLAGAGWLRTRSSGSSTATYHLDIWRRVTGPDAGKMVTEGQMNADPFMLVEAQRSGRAVLVLSTGEPIAVEITNRTQGVADFVVIGALPPH